MKFLTKGLIAATFIAFGQLASAATISPTAQTPQIDGNDQLNGGGPNAAATVAALDSLLSPYFEAGFGAYEIGRLDVGGTSPDISLTLTSGTTGTWSYTGADIPFVVVYKGANEWIGQYFQGGITGNMFDLADLDGAALENNGGNVPDLSHLTLYGVDGVEVSVSPVPLPAGGLLLLAGFGAFAVVKRRKS